MADSSDQPQADEDPPEPDELEERTRAPLDTYANVPSSPLPEMAPDGGPIAQPIGNPPAVPAATASLFVCLRGPCRHYWELETHIVSGNPASTWDPVDGLKDQAGQPIRQPRQISRTCLVHPGFETELTEDVVYACSRWDPEQPLPWYVRWLGGNTRERRRRVHLKLHPQYAPAPVHMFQCECEGCPSCEFSTNNCEMCDRLAGPQASDHVFGSALCSSCAAPAPYPTIRVRVQMGVDGPVIVPASTSKE